MNQETLAKYTSKQAAVSQCEGCDYVVAADKSCTLYNSPAYKWSVGACNMATHVKSEVVQKAKMLNPLKASKLKARGRG